MRAYQRQTREKSSRRRVFFPIRWEDAYSSMNHNRGFGYPGFEQDSELLGEHRPAEVVTLCLIAQMSLKKCQLFPCLHSLCNDPQLQAAAHADHRGHDGRIVRSGRDLTDERLVDFQSIDRELSQIAQAGVTRPEIIDGNLHTSCSQRLQ